MCPPGVDQTGRGPQHWRVLAPELQQFSDIECAEADESWNWGVDLRTKLLNPDLCWDAWGKLARPVISTPACFETPIPCSDYLPSRTSSSRVVKNRRVERKTRTVKTLSALEGLSSELLHMIVEQLDGDKVAILALGLSSQRLWQVVLRHVHSSYVKCATPWAGKKITFQGSYSMDVPEPFTENGLVESITGTNWFGDMCAARRFFWAHHDLSKTPLGEEGAWLEAARKHYSDIGLRRATGRRSKHIWGARICSPGLKVGCCEI